MYAARNSWARGSAAATADDSEKPKRQWITWLGSHTAVIVRRFEHPGGRGRRKRRFRGPVLLRQCGYGTASPPPASILRENLFPILNRPRTRPRETVPSENFWKPIDCPSTIPVKKKKWKKKSSCKKEKLTPSDVLGAGEPPHRTRLKRVNEKPISKRSNASPRIKTYRRFELPASGVFMRRGPRGAPRNEKHNY